MVFNANNEDKFESNSNFTSGISDPFVINSNRVESDSNIESNENSDENIDGYRCSANETALLNASLETEFISIAPSENVAPETLINDTFCEELGQPNISRTDKFGFQGTTSIFATSNLRNNC